jgi:heat shock protein HslJ
MNGNPHAGELAAKYVMQKGEPAVEEKYWKLTSLYGIGVEKEKTWRKEPHIMLVADENRLNGSGHCNIISGNYVLTEGGGLKFSQMVLTKTECENMDIETNLAKVLEMIDGFTISGDTLKLHKAKMVPSAVFVAVYPK